ncbi:MAG TPA: YncE family protein [Flavobacterium sp.]|uniref:YncE family protein n=1 Tax=Flavobacterium sp. TaxID=239 RepID=UPI002B5DC774|nr:YncE family protein [Flavobacterium sp.]HNP32327.1 YncE family protein [Flavobacterium sp.]
MKTIKLNSLYALATLTVASFFITSCSKDSNSATPLNVDYPAAYVVNGQDGTVSVIKLSTGEVTGTISFPSSAMVSWPHHISYHQGHLALGVPGMDFSAGHTTSGSMPGKMLILNAADGSIVENMDLPVMNHNTIYSPDGTEIWVPQMDMDGKVLVYNATNYTLMNTITVGMMPAELTFSSDGTKAYVANGDDDTVSVINVATKAVISTVNVGDNPVGAWTGSNGQMFVDNEDGQSISVINVATNAVDQTIALGFMPGIAAHNGIKNELWVTDPMNAKVHYYTWDSGMGMWMDAGVINAGNGTHAVAFTTDGNTAYVTNQSAKSVSVINVINHTVIKTITVGNKPNGIVLKM